MVSDKCDAGAADTRSDNTCNHEPIMTEESSLPVGCTSGPFPVRLIERGGLIVHACRHCGLLYAVRRRM